MAGIHCVNCGAELVLVNDWHSVCPACNLYASCLGSGGGTGVDGLEDLRKSNFEVLLHRLEKMRPLAGLRILEVGCSKGLFLEMAKSRGMIEKGVEPEFAMAEAARSKGFNVIDGFFPNALLEEERFDIIIFNDVFEHLPDPKGALLACRKHLSSDGILTINLPSSHGVFFRISKALWRLGWAGPYERLWQKGFPSPHTFYFNPDNLRNLVEETTGMRQIDQHALPSIHPKGTRERVRATYKGIIGELISIGALCISIFLPVLPQDISVSYFEKVDP
ncbi:class I SAM-dependent methyltransferase [Silicimonas sp. MF1-12-2]|uniref:class I SAM-dependent methyltransferase n=1 Tax=Silicimonas sp. MF1-12-2 TaxID=3384793 RepID=UPI0039B67DEF